MDGRIANGSPAGAGSRIALFGGTFNPVHYGHLVAAQDAREAFDCDRTVWIPVASPPHKDAPALAPADDRLAMVRLAVDGDPGFEVSRLEIDRGGRSYSIDTVRAWRDREPDAEILFLIGSDSLATLATWREIDELARLCQFVTIARPGFSTAQITADALGLPEPVCAGLRDRVVHVHPVGISSSEIRERLAAGRSIRYLVPEAVRSWILSRGLYDGEEPSSSTLSNC